MRWRESPARAGEENFYDQRYEINNQDYDGDITIDRGACGRDQPFRRRLHLLKRAEIPAVGNPMKAVATVMRDLAAAMRNLPKIQ